jgi:predicted TIM-barrel fold metal-dependent hydrolase
MRPRRGVESGLGATGVLLVMIGLCTTGCAESCGRKRAPADGKGADVAKPAKGNRLPRIDVHTHISPQGLERALAVMDQWGIDGMVNLSGMVPGPPRHMLENQLMIARASGGRIAVFTNVNFVKAIRTRPDYGTALAEELSVAKEMGAVGLKIPKGLGLGYPAPDGQSVLAVDDPKLDPLFEEAGKLGMPVAIHTGDPKAFWLPPDEKNERIDELRAHPEWSFFGEPVPSWQGLYDQFERRVARHPKTIFIGVHFGNDPEDPVNVGRMLDKYPNLYIDTAARVPEIGRQDATKMRQFFEKYQDRILFGTDLGVGPTQDDMMYGSNGASPPTLDDERRYFESTWRYFETSDKQFESPTPIQGRWKIDGLGLSEQVLRKLYFDNAARLLKWKPPIGQPKPATQNPSPSTAPTK